MGNERVELRGLQGNRGDHATKADILGALQRPDGTPKVDFATICEMHNQQHVLNQIDAMPQWRVLRGEAKASVLVVNTRTMNVVDPRVIDLLPVARRAGKYNMQKDATGALVKHEPSNRFMELYAMHNIQSLWMPGRRAAGKLHNQKFVNETNPHPRLTIAGADWNDEWDGRSMEPFRRAGWKHSPKNLGTFKKPRYGRGIDFFVWDDKDKDGPILGQPETHGRNVKGTDHLWVYVTWPIDVRD